MQDFDLWQQDFLQQRSELELTLSESSADFTVAERLVTKLLSHLEAGLNFADEPERYGIFLQEQLDWLNSTITSLSQKKDEMATDLLQLERRKKARARYNQNT